MYIYIFFFQSANLIAIEIVSKESVYWSFIELF